MVTNKIQTFLDEMLITYVLHTKVSTDPGMNFSAYAKSVSATAIKSVLLADEEGCILIAFNSADGLDINSLNREMNRDFQLYSGKNHKKQLMNFSVRNLPPLGHLFQLPMIVDENLIGKDKYIFEFEKSDNYFEINQKGFKTLFKGALNKNFTKSIPNQKSKDNETVVEINSEIAANKQADIEGKSKKEIKTLLTLDIVKQRFSAGVELPVLPKVADQLVDLKTRDSFELLDLVHIIETDPVISAKITAYANSPFFSYQGKLETVQEAVYHVLGVDLSLNVSLALALGQQFKGSTKGPVGATAVWRHAVYCAVLSQSISTKIVGQPDIKPGTAYLFGLLHNIGFLALSHLYKPQFSKFNKAVELKKKLPLNVIEKKLLGVSHTDVGGLLMASWNMPEQFKIVVEQHHNINYQGAYQTYVNIVSIANYLLHTVGLGDVSDDTAPESLFQHYNLKESELTVMLEIVMGWHENLDHLAHQLAA